MTLVCVIILPVESNGFGSVFVLISLHDLQTDSLMKLIQESSDMRVLLQIQYYSIMCTMSALGLLADPLYISTFNRITISMGKGWPATANVAYHVYLLHPICMGI